MIRFAPVLAMFALFAAACGADDATAETTFTVPVITEAPAGGSEDDGADADSVSDDEADADAGATEQDDGGGDSGQDDSGDDAEVDDPPEPLPSPDRTFGDLAEASIAVEVIASVPRITDAVVAPNGEFWVALWNGEVAVMDHRSGGIGATRVDISGETEGEGENGLLGIAVNDEALYLNYTDIAGDTHVDAWILDSEGLPGERREILFVDQPDWNHNGGGLEFGPDGYLYIGMGDGGGPGDPSDHGQNPNTLLGAILRIDPTPNADVPYAIPESNPYVDGGGAPEVFITGTRNPWRFSFDSQTGDLWVSDVGQDDWEELNLLLVENRIGLGQ